MTRPAIWCASTSHPPRSRDAANEDTRLRECLALAGDCHSAYACGSDITRRMANQAFFTRIYLDADDQISTEPAAPSYRLLPGPSVQRQALTWASLHQDAKKRPTRTPRVAGRGFE